MLLRQEKGPYPWWPFPDSTLFQINLVPHALFPVPCQESSHLGRSTGTLHHGLRDIPRFPKGPTDIDSRPGGLGRRKLLRATKAGFIELDPHHLSKLLHLVAHGESHGENDQIELLFPERPPFRSVCD